MVMVRDMSMQFRELCECSPRAHTKRGICECHGKARINEKSMGTVRFLKRCDWEMDSICESISCRSSIGRNMHFG